MSTTARARLCALSAALLRAACSAACSSWRREYRPTTASTSTGRMIIKPCQKKEGRRALLDLSMDVGLDITAAWRKPTAQLSWFCKIRNWSGAGAVGVGVCIRGAVGTIVAMSAFLPP